MAIRILVNGAAGRMGSLAVEALSKDPDFLVVAQTGRADDLEKSIASSCAEVVLDLTEPKGLFSRVKSIIAKGARPVIGTSGLRTAEIAVLQVQCQEAGLGGYIVPNFSLGIALMMRCIQEVSAYFSSAEIIEMHHENKKDAPSGTAKYTRELLESVTGITPASVDQKNRAQKMQAPIPIHSIRLPGVVAKQSVIFGAEGETLKFTHDSTSRTCFMPGVRYCCKKVIELDKIVWGMDFLCEKRNNKPY